MKNTGCPKQMHPLKPLYLNYTLYKSSDYDLAEEQMTFYSNYLFVKLQGLTPLVSALLGSLSDFILISLNLIM